MAEIIKNLKKGFVQGTGIVMAMFMGGALYVFASSLTATDGETLTATKWNALVDKVNTLETTSVGYDYDSGWFDVGTTAGYAGATTDGTRNTYLKTHNLNSYNIETKVFYRENSSAQKIYLMGPYTQYYPNTWVCYGPHIEFENANITKILVRYAGCNQYYASSVALSKTTGQYRVLIKKLP